jgi:hypothetical protein
MPILLPGVPAVVWLLLVNCCHRAVGVQQAYLQEDFGEGWQSRWVYSSDAKYEGQFESFTPELWKDPGIKVGRRLRACSGHLSPEFCWVQIAQIARRIAAGHGEEQALRPDSRAAAACGPDQGPGVSV